MPILTLKIAAEPNPDLAERAALTVADLTERVLHKKRELIAVAVATLAPSSWFVGGRSLQALGKSSFHLDVRVTQGTNTKDEKAQFVAEVFAALRGLLGELHEVSYAVVDEVPADAWGYGGVTQERRYIERAPASKV
jgi:4-oxalocrotonate tautomerase